MNDGSEIIMKQECTATHVDPTATTTAANQGIPRDEVIAHLTQLNTLLTVTADFASEASTDVLNAQVLESELAAKATADATKLMMTDLRQQFELALAAQVLSSKEATSTLTLQMAIERDALLQTALIASEQSTLLVRDLTRKHEMAAAAAALLLETSLTAQLATFQLATEKAEAATNTRLALKRVEAKEAAVVARVASELLLTNLRHKYETAAVAAACASDSSLVAQRVASNLATEEAKVEANSRVATEQNAAKIAAIIASKASDTKFLDQKSRFEAMAAAAADASDSSLIAERHASQLASEVAELQATSRIAVARNESEEAALIASKASASKFHDQRLMYEAAASAAADASDSSLTAQRFASQLATEEAELEANSRMKIKRDESTQAALIASEASALQLVNLQLKYENAAAAAANASDSSLVAQRLASQQATEEAKVETNSRIASERSASKQAAIIASEASDTKFLDQKSRFEAMAAAAADASDSSLIAERHASQLASEVAELQATSRIAVARNESEEAALIASKASASKFHDQRLMYEAAASAAADASDSSLTAQRFASQLATEEAELEANSRMKMKRDESTQAALIASEASALQLVNLQLKYENAAAAAANASDSSLVAQRLASQQATEEAKLVAELRMTTERNASKQAAIIASEASDTKLLDQKSRYETAALAASDASETKMAFEQSIFEMSTKLASDAFAVKLSDNTRNAERLELQAKFALMESVQLRNISANVAHDLKSPLHTLLIGLESMRTGDNSSSSLVQNAEVLDTLNSACAFMTSAISRTIEFSKTSSGVSLTPSNSSFNLLSALNNPVKWIKSMLTPDGNKSITLDTLPEGVSTLITDKHWVEENLLCLLSNAVKYSNEGVIHVAVTLEGDSDGDQVHITVEDSGIGISSESKQLLFKQFSSVQNMAVGSTGLGLYSLSKRVEAIGGSCGVNDRKDGKEGSTFWFSFPYRPDIGEDVEKGSLMDSFSVPSDLRKRLDILIVDDSTSVVKILSNKLIRAGHRVVTASNGAAGLEKMIAMRGRLDVVFMDIQMPVMDGIEATKRYREIERLHNTGQHLPIICSTANSGGEAENLAMAAGVDSFLPKPFTTTVLLSVVDEIIRGLVA